MNRADAYDMIDDVASSQAALRELARHWDLSGWWNIHATWSADEMRDHVDYCADDARASGHSPRDSDETGLTAPAFDRVLVAEFPVRPYTAPVAAALRYAKDLPSGRYVLVTDGNLCAPAVMSDGQLVVGLYGTDDQWIEDAGGSDLSIVDAMAVYDVLVQS